MSNETLQQPKKAPPTPPPATTITITDGSVTVEHLESLKELCVLLDQKGKDALARDDLFMVRVYRELLSISAGWQKNAHARAMREEVAHIRRQERDLARRKRERKAAAKHQAMSQIAASS